MCVCVFYQKHPKAMNKWQLMTQQCMFDVCPCRNLWPFDAKEFGIVTVE